MSISDHIAHVNGAPAPAGTADRILDVLRVRTGRPDLDYASAPITLSGGYWAELFAVRFADPPPELAGDLVIRVMPDALLARKEVIVQSGVAAQGFPAPAVRLVADGGNGRPFMVMDRAPGAPMLGGLSATAVFSRLPQLLRRLPVRLADVSVRLHAIDPAPIRSQLEAVTVPRAPASVSEFLDALIDAAEYHGRLDLAHAGRRLVELRPTPGEEVICHGDLHPFNMLVDGDRITIVDWTVALIAEPAYDVAFTWLLLVHAPIHLPAPLRAPIQVASRLVARSYLRRYSRRARIPVPDASLSWHVGLHCLRALVEVAGWKRAGEVAAHAGHPWLTTGAAFADRLQQLTGVEVD